MLFSYNWLKDYIKGKLPEPKKLAELLTMHSFETTCQKSIVNSQESVLDIDVLPNRACDCLSHIGIARECGALLKSEIRNPKSEIKEDKKLKASDFIKVEIEDKNACPRYTARVIKDVRVAPSPKWIQQRLKICGLRPINNIVDIANYVMLETGQPLHAFDLEKLESANPKSKIQNPKQILNSKFQTKKLIVRFANERERILTLDEEKYDLNENILVIADTKKPVAIAGVKGGKIPEIDRKTKTIVIESANFNQKIIRRGSKKLNLRTDASWRFENGISPNLTAEAINRAAFLIQKIAGGKIAKGLVDIYSQKVLSPKIKLDLNYVESLLGEKISKKEIIKILKLLDFKIREEKAKNGEQILVTVPARRLDISIPEDLIEEVGRIYGYEKIQVKSPILPITLSEKNKDLLWERKIKEIIKDLGFTEVYLYSFISEKDSEIFSLTPKRFISTLIEIKNPVSSNTKYLRPSLLVNLLKTVKESQKEQDRIRIFEIGKTYYWKVESRKSKVEKPPSTPDLLHSKVIEKKILGGLVFGKNKFYEIKGVIEALLESLGIVDLFFDPFKSTPEETPRIFWQRGESSEIRIGESEIGFLGKIREEILDFYQVSDEVFAFEIDFEKILELVKEEHEYEAPSFYPEMIRDLAILVPTQTLAGEVIQEIHSAGRKIIRDVEVFDIYEGPPLPKGKKNLAFHIIYQAKDRTLNSKEVDKIQEKIIKVLEENIEWQVRR